MIVFPHAKINLGLHVLAKRADGFHEIETCLVPIALTDALEAVEATDEKTSMSVSGIPVPPDGKENLCLRAYQLLQKDYSIPPLKIYLHKHIPIGAGLGGGSADAAFALKLLNQMFGLQIPGFRLHEYAASLGSDCPFFLHQQACIASGRGEILKPIPSLNLSSWHLLLVTPPLHVPTAAAYSQVKPRKPANELLQVLEQPVSQWKHLLVNDFEESVFRQYPHIDSLKQAMYQMGAAYAAMSGSGSSVFGLFSEKPIKPFSPAFSDCFIWEERID